MDMLELADQLETLPDTRPARADGSAGEPAHDGFDDPVMGTASRAQRQAAGSLVSPRAPMPVPESNLYGSFFLASTELALPVEVIQEVVVFPERVTSIPLSPAFLVGVFNLRGTIIPVIDLRTILGMPDAVARETQKVAIVDFAGTRVGLVFDATGEMLRVQASDRHPFHYADDDPAHAAHRAARHVVKGALKLDGGERLVQILDPAGLMQIEQVPQILDKQRADGSVRRLAMTQRRQCVSFRLGHAALAFEIGAIHEIIRVPAVQESVLASTVCLGMFNLRGDIMPLVDFGALLGMAPRVDTVQASGMDDARRIVVMRIGEDSIGLLVDCVDSIVGYTDDQLLPIPSVGTRRGGLFAGCISREGHDDIVMLAHATLLTNSELNALTQGHSRLYAHGDGRRTQQRQRGERRVYITFKLDGLMALPITGVREIIRYTDDFMRPPGLPEAVHGLLNLRRRLVTVVDLRTLYELAPRESGAASDANAKILIVERDNDAYGLIVDTVENIAHVYASDKMAVPSIMMDASARRLRADLTEIVEVPKATGQTDGPTLVMMIFDVVKLTDRIAQMIDA
ncbi:MAG TPA: chemotaxis protein CheW [Pararobbsia sp.]|jgi:purine-binding chemotaxis protein CheW|nr:chemotaxis protein CheW [Pararobbsia sp.]